MQWRRAAGLVGQADAEPRLRRALGRREAAGRVAKLGLVCRHQSSRSETDLRCDRARTVFPFGRWWRELGCAAAPSGRNPRAGLGAGIGGTMDTSDTAMRYPG